MLTSATKNNQQPGRSRAKLTEVGTDWDQFLAVWGRSTRIRTLGQPRNNRGWTKTRPKLTVGSLVRSLATQVTVGMEVEDSGTLDSGRGGERRRSATRSANGERVALYPPPPARLRSPPTTRPPPDERLCPLSEVGGSISTIIIIIFSSCFSVGFFRFPCPFFVDGGCVIQLIVCSPSGSLREGQSLISPQPIGQAQCTSSVRSRNGSNPGALRGACQVLL